MKSNETNLDRQVRTWIEVRSMGRLPSSAPEVSVPPLPEAGTVVLSEVPKLQGSLERLPVASELGISIPALASLMSLMPRQDAEQLYGWISLVPFDKPPDPVEADKWFRLCHLVNPAVMGRAAKGFFRLSELCLAGLTESPLSKCLSCWFKVLRSCGAVYPGHADAALKFAGSYPERFCFVCLRIASGGADIVKAMERFYSRMAAERISQETGAYLLDFTVETGWLLEDSDFDQIWKLIARRGNLVHVRLSGGLVPVSSIRFFAGILGGIEEKGDIEELFRRDRIHRAAELFETTGEEIAPFLQKNSDLAGLIDDLLEMDLLVEAISHGVAGSTQSAVGRAIVRFLDSVPGQLSQGKLIRFLKASGEEISGDVVHFLAQLVENTEPENRMSPSNTIRFSKIVSGILPISTTLDRTALKAFYRVLVEMDHSSARWALIQLDRAAFHSGVSLSSVLSSASLLIRAADEGNRKDYLSRITSTGRLLEALSPMDRKRTLSGLAPMWVETLFSFKPEVEKTVIDFIYKISDLTNRNRFLENVVTRLLQEVHPDDSVFRDCLAFAVSGYNSSTDLEKLRETEHRVFQKVLRAGDRIEAVDKQMTDLLAIPGLDGQKTGELIAGIRTICDRFSRQAVWEEGGDRLFTEFLEKGVTNLLRAFVDAPQVLEAIDSAVIDELATKLMPGEKGSFSSGVVNPGATAYVFFSFMLPACVSLFGRDVSYLPDFLFSLTENLSRSVGGMTGDRDLAEYLEGKLEQEILEDRVAVLDAWLEQKTPPPLRIEENWSVTRRGEWNHLKSVSENTRMKLFGAVSAVTGSLGGDVRETILNIAAILTTELDRGKIPGASRISLNWNRTMVDELLDHSGGAPLFSLLAAHKAGRDPEPGLHSYLGSIQGYMEQDYYNAWRQAALPTLMNCAIEIVLVSGNSAGFAYHLARSAMDTVEFLGYSDAEGFLSTLQQSLRNIQNSQDVYDAMEKSFLYPLWKRNSAERLDLLMLGLPNSRLLMGILLERLSMESSVGNRISFMNYYANFFISVEKALLGISSQSVRSTIADALAETWIFSGKGQPPSKAVQEVGETAEFVQDVFRRTRYGSGIVTASEAGEISADMRRKYRDNADSVAIILRWTVDPAREGLLKMLEESQTLLQAAGSDAELMRLLDVHGAEGSFIRKAQHYAEDPIELKKMLLAKDGNGTSS